MKIQPALDIVNQKLEQALNRYSKPTLTSAPTNVTEDQLIKLFTLKDLLEANKPKTTRKKDPVKKGTSP